MRLYLGERKESVNRGIAETLSDEDDIGNFWAYNNGVTFV
ncbi:AIPR family protein, partial [bacterium]|nr:AIPR family protein [bacterium]